MAFGPLFLRDCHSTSISHHSPSFDISGVNGNAVCDNLPAHQDINNIFIVFLTTQNCPSSLVAKTNRTTSFYQITLNSKFLFSYLISLKTLYTNISFLICL